MKTIAKRRRKSKLVGLYIYRQRPNEIFIDWDRPTLWWNDANARFLIRPFARIEAILDLPSVNYHNHYVILLDRSLEYHELICLGTMMGDDRTRTMFDLFRLRKGVYPIIASRYDWSSEKAKIWDGRPPIKDLDLGPSPMASKPNHRHKDEYKPRTRYWRSPDFTATEENITPWTTAASAIDFIDNREPNFKGGFPQLPRW